MIFSIQRFLEDNFERRGLSDVDQYAVKVANLYGRLRPTTSDKDVLRSLHRIHTSFFHKNSTSDRWKFESELLVLLDRKFKKKRQFTEFPGGVQRERRSLNKASRISIRVLLDNFRRAVESRAIDVFWSSRKQCKLISRPEHIGQGLLAVFAKGVLSTNGRGLILRELCSGVGFVDVAIAFSSILHLVELKVLKSKFVGANQLEVYMKTEGRREGWLVVFDARPSFKKTRIPGSIETANGLIQVVTIDVNPQTPSRKSR